MMLLIEASRPIRHGRIFIFLMMLLIEASRPIRHGRIAEWTYFHFPHDVTH